MKKKSKQHVARKNEIIQAALTLFCTKGYSGTSVSDILEAVGVAKGTFYHYFKSKEILLDSLVEDMMQEMADGFTALADRTDLHALDRLNQVFSITREAEFNNKEATYAFISLYEKDENLLMRHKLEKKYRGLLEPVFMTVLRQGIDEGYWRIPYPAAAAAIMATLFMGMLADGSAMMIDAHEHPERLEEMINGLKMVGLAMDRLLGIPENSVHIADENEMRSFLNHPTDKGGNHAG